MTRQEEEALVLRWMPYAASIARRKAPPWLKEDAVSEGCMALLLALRSYDAARECSLRAWISGVVQGHVIDWLRRQDRLARHHQAAVAKGKKDHTLRLVLPLNEKLDRGNGGVDFAAQLEDRRHSPDRLQAEDVRAILKRLAGKDWPILEAKLEGRNLDTLATVWGVTVSRVCQRSMHLQRKLRRHLGRRLEDLL